MSYIEEKYGEDIGEPDFYDPEDYDELYPVDATTLNNVLADMEAGDLETAEIIAMEELEDELDEVVEDV
jgi:hypothetical protein